MIDELCDRSLPPDCMDSRRFYRRSSRLDSLNQAAGSLTRSGCWSPRAIFLYSFSRNSSPSDLPLAALSILCLPMLTCELLMEWREFRALKLLFSRKVAASMEYLLSLAPARVRNWLPLSRAIEILPSMEAFTAPPFSLRLPSLNRLPPPTRTVVPMATL